jgi:hypothetical protein
MKKIITGLVALSTLVACQDEMYQDDLKKGGSGETNQAVYIDGDKTLNITLANNSDYTVNNFVVKLVSPSDGKQTAYLELGNQSQLDEYNQKNGTTYSLLPSSMYEANKNISFKTSDVIGNTTLKLKKVQFPLGKSFALPIKLKSDNVKVISEQDSFIVLIEQDASVKVLNFNRSGVEKDNIFAQDYKVDQWTFEVMIKRSAYNQNNRSIGGTKNTDHPLSEIYTRFGDVTIQPNQLQIKTGGSQIDIPADKLSAKADEWYMLAFWYDGTTTKVFVNGEEVASREIRTGSYSVTGIWLGDSNEYIREVRFWKKAVKPSEIKKNVWKSIDPKSEGLLFYYPMNGKKYDHASGEITDDETKIWDWSTTGAHLNMPTRARYDDNGGKGYTFPPKK